MRSSKERRANIRFSEEEYSRVSNDAVSYGETVPGIVKAVYFDHLPPLPKYAREDAVRILAAINRVGNNINQIARQVNTGIGGNVATLLQEAVTYLSILKAHTVGA